MGLVITVINKDSLAEQSGLMINDKIISYNGVEQLLNLRDLINAVNHASDKTDEVEVIIKRNNKTESLNLKPGKLGVTAIPSVDIDKAKELNDYSDGRSIASFATILGWILVLLSVIFLLIGIADGSFIIIIAACASIISGLFFVMGAQATKAVMDNASYSRQILEELKNNSKH
jgi:hypothetical protein